MWNSEDDFGDQMWKSYSECYCQKFNLLLRLVWTTCGTLRKIGMYNVWNFEKDTYGPHVKL